MLTITQDVQPSLWGTQPIYSRCVSHQEMQMPAQATKRLQNSRSPWQEHIPHDKKESWVAGNQMIYYITKDTVPIHKVEKRGS